MEMPRPVHNLAIRVGALFSAEWRPADQAFEHNRPNTPPVASKIVTFPCKDFRRDVVGCADCRIGELPTGFAPGVDLVTVADRKLYLVERHTVAVLTVA